ncbi:unnamed protein product [Moneuplotes crassus]|uniref:Uncharacterized protein n=1 Tax=Euplotes crassus TaxID=5936 RepID=A0AAD1UJW9_EUPCR|nr:unnamed protein product [Moneuplotes crassus]
MGRFKLVLLVLALQTIFIVAYSYQIDPLLVSKYIVNGESTPSFYPNDVENTTKVDYGLGPNEITDLGLKNMNKMGKVTKKELSVDRNIIPTFYDPKYVFTRGMSEQKTIYSAYSYLLGMFPHSINGVDFKSELMDDGETIPLKYLDNIRKRSGMDNRLCKNRTLQYYGGNRDYEFIESHFDQYPSLKYKMLKNLQDAKVIFEREYGNELYETMSRTMRIDTDRLDFYNSIDYLEDYVTAKYNKKKTPYHFDESTDLLIEVYYTHYFKLGIFKDPAILRVFTHSYFVNLAKEMLLKSQVDQESIYVGLANENIDTMGLSLHFGNQITFLAIMHQINTLEQYFPSYGDELSWTLYKKRGEYWVFGEYDDEKLNLESKANSMGEISLDRFITYICSKVYFGDIKKVLRGEEDPDDFLDSPHNCKQFFENHYTFEEELLQTRIDPYSFQQDDSNLIDVNKHCSLIDDEPKVIEKPAKKPKTFRNVTQIIHEVQVPITATNPYPSELSYNPYNPYYHNDWD